MVGTTGPMFSINPGQENGIKSKAIHRCCVDKVSKIDNTPTCKDRCVRQSLSQFASCCASLKCSADQLVSLQAINYHESLDSGMLGGTIMPNLHE